jgi:molybdenum cofactor biosynthesis enzyme MoaA
VEDVGLAGWTFSEQSLLSAVEGDILLNPSLDLGNPCNLNCPYCFIEEKGSERKIRKAHELSYREIREVIDDFLQGGAETINLVGAGEPMIDLQFKEVIDQIHHGGARTVLFTNGVMIARNKAILDFLFERGVTIVLKFNAISSTLQDAVVGKKGYTQERDRALLALIERGFNTAHPTRLGLDTLAFEGNLLDLPKIHRWCRKNNVHPLTAEFIPAGRTSDGTVEAVASLDRVEPDLASEARHALRPLRADQREWLQSALEEVDKELGIVHLGAKAYFGGGGCTQLLGVYVDIEGRIWPCVARSRTDRKTTLPLGWLRKGDKPSDVWRRSGYLQRLRSEYTGACPYKAPLRHAGWESLPVSTSRKMDAELIQIGSKSLGRP